MTGMDMAYQLMQQRTGMYWHMLPFHAQARRMIWDGIDANTGERFIDRAFPPSERESVSQMDMRITMLNGSSWQLLGSDNYNRHVGGDPCFVLFSEFSRADPNAWTYIRPILSQNNGTAGFITTFKGRNHAWKLWQLVKDNAAWYCDLRTIDDTVKHDGKTPIIDQAAYQKEIDEGMSPEMARQEFYCDPLAINEGAYFIKQYNALPQKRIVSRDVSYKCAAWAFTKSYIAVAVYQPLTQAILDIHTYEAVELSEAMDRFRILYPRTMHHMITCDESTFQGAGEVNVSNIEVSQDVAMRQARVGWLLNKADVTETAQASLTDVLMEYTKENLRKDDSPPAVAAVEALAIAAQHCYEDGGTRNEWGPRASTDLYDRGVI